MRTITTALFVMVSIACVAQTKPKCDALTSLLADSAVSHYLLKNADAKMPIALFDVGNKYSGYGFPDCNSITSAGKTYSIDHGQDFYHTPCKCTRIFVSATALDNKLFISIANEGSLEVRATYASTGDGYALVKKELEPVAEWVEE